MVGRFWLMLSRSNTGFHGEQMRVANVFTRQRLYSGTISQNTTTLLSSSVTAQRPIALSHSLSTNKEQKSTSHSQAAKLVSLQLVLPLHSHPPNFFFLTLHGLSLRESKSQISSSFGIPPQYSHVINSYTCPPLGFFLLIMETC